MFLESPYRMFTSGLSLYFDLRVHGAWMSFPSSKLRGLESSYIASEARIPSDWATDAFSLRPTCRRTLLYIRDMERGGGLLKL